MEYLFRRRRYICSSGLMHFSFQENMPRRTYPETSISHMPADEAHRRNWKGSKSYILGPENSESTLPYRIMAGWFPQIRRIPPGSALRESSFSIKSCSHSCVDTIPRSPSTQSSFRNTASATFSRISSSYPKLSRYVFQS